MGGFEQSDMNMLQYDQMISTIGSLEKPDWHNFLSNRWILLKFYQEILWTLFYTGPASLAAHIKKAFKKVIEDAIWFNFIIFLFNFEFLSLILFFVFVYPFSLGILSFLQIYLNFFWEVDN